MTATIRTFVAIPLPQAVLDGLAAVQRRLDRVVPSQSVRWTRPESVHLTLKFLGDTPTAQIPDISRALAAVARSNSVLRLSVGGLGCFPNHRNPRIVWTGVEESSGNLMALHSAIEGSLEPLGYLPEKRSFSAHLTLGRLRRGTARRDAARVGEVVKKTRLDPTTGIAAAHYSLIRSKLKPSGAEYITLEEFPLGE